LINGLPIEALLFLSIAYKPYSECFHVCRQFHLLIVILPVEYWLVLFQIVWIIRPSFITVPLWCQIISSIMHYTLIIVVLAIRTRSLFLPGISKHPEITFWIDSNRIPMWISFKKFRIRFNLFDPTRGWRGYTHTLIFCLPLSRGVVIIKTQKEYINIFDEICTNPVIIIYRKVSELVWYLVIVWSILLGTYIFGYHITSFLIVSIYTCIIVYI